MSESVMSPEDVRAEVARVPWFHQIDLGNGIVTPGVDPSETKLQTLGMPRNLAGMSVLDVGAWDGFFSFEAERRGASRVVAVDSFSWNGSNWGSKQGFLLARRALGSRVEDMECDVLDLDPNRLGTFDLVFFLGVLYHMRHPLLALEKVASVTRGRLILETHVDMVGEHRPAVAFYPGSELGNDTTNWCGPNLPALEAMLKTVGFEEIRLVWRNFGLREVVEAGRRRGWTGIKSGVRTVYAGPGKIPSRRVVVHAWK